MVKLIQSPPFKTWMCVYVDIKKQIGPSFKYNKEKSLGLAVRT